MRPQSRLHLAVAGIILATALLQTIVISRIGWPGVGPDLLLLAVIAVGLATTPNYGAVVGFSAGLVADVLPPDVTTIGTTAFALALVGYLAGGVKDPRGLALAQVLGLIAGLAALAATIQITFAWVLADRAVGVFQTVGFLLAFIGVTTLVGVLLVPITVRTLRRIDRSGAIRERHVRRESSQMARK